MKKVLTIAFVLFIQVLSSQNERVINAGSGSDVLLNAGNATLSSYGNSAIFYNPKNKVEGSVHLFKSWKNHAVIFTSDDNKFSLKNINLNIQRNAFESKISETSIFTFSLNNIEKFVINNKVYKNFYYNGANRIFEMIYESDEFSIIKGYRIELIKGSVNPQVNRKNDKYIQRDSYYLKQNENIKTFKLSKKRILNLIGDKDRIEKAENFVSSNKLSYKKEYDVFRILDYISKN